jgi:hypothetical protein
MAACNSVACVVDVSAPNTGAAAINAVAAAPSIAVLRTLDITRDFSGSRFVIRTPPNVIARLLMRRAARLLFSPRDPRHVGVTHAHP